MREGRGEREWERERERGREVSLWESGLPINSIWRCFIASSHSLGVIIFSTRHPLARSDVGFCCFSRRSFIPSRGWAFCCLHIGPVGSPFLRIFLLLLYWSWRRNQIQGLQENVRKLPKLPSLSPLAIKHLWIRTALFEKVLDKIVHYLVENSRWVRESSCRGVLWCHLLPILGTAPYGTKQPSFLSCWCALDLKAIR